MQKFIVALSLKHCGHSTNISDVFVQRYSDYVTSYLFSCNVEH